MIYNLLLILLLFSFGISYYKRKRYFALFESFIHLYRKRKNRYAHILKGNTSNIKLPEIKTSKEIPKIIFQTHKDRNLIPEYYIKNLKRLNSDWEYKFYDNNEAKKFLREEFGKEFEEKFDYFNQGPHKADLWRLCILYKYGGCYIDADVDMLVPLQEIISKSNNNLIIPKTETGLIMRKRLFNALIICNRGNKYIGECIKKMMLVTNFNLWDYMYNLYLMDFVLEGNYDDLITEKYKKEKDSKISNYMYIEDLKIAKSKREDYIR